jgi:hypothetical protein
VLDSNGDPLAPNGDTFVSLEGRKRETGDSESSAYYEVSPSSSDGSAFSDSQIPKEVTRWREPPGQAGIARNAECERRLQLILAGNGVMSGTNRSRRLRSARGDSDVVVFGADGRRLPSVG